MHIAHVQGASSPLLIDLYSAEVNHKAHGARCPPLKTTNICKSSLSDTYSPDNLLPLGATSGNSRSVQASNHTLELMVRASKYQVNLSVPAALNQLFYGCETIYRNHS